MAISALRLSNFRNIPTADLSFCTSGINLITGQNGSGKTSLLEAMHYLALGRSFRTADANRLIHHQTPKCTVFAQIKTMAACQITAGIERERSGMVRAKMGDMPLSNLAEFATLLPIRLLNTHSHQLIEGGPLYRRQYLDWGVFYAESSFLSCWRHFERVLKQRNALLRAKAPLRELAVWTEQLVHLGLALDALRRSYITALTPILAELVTKHLNFPPIKIRYVPGWDEKMDYGTALLQSMAEALRLGYTPCGPHRADIALSFPQGAVKHFLSRGQQKLLICAMIAAQGALLAKCADQPLIYLVDDLPAELDLPSQHLLITLLARQSSQVFVTAVTGEAVQAICVVNEIPLKMFHVEHNQIIEQISHAKLETLIETISP